MNRYIILLLFCIVYLQDIDAQNNAANLFITKCASCHKKNGDAPFPLETTKDVLKRSNTLIEVITSGYMPPWKADNSYCSYANNRALTNSQKNILVEWIKGGARDLTNTSNNVKTKNNVTKPNMTISSGNVYTVKGDNIERFVIIKIPFENTVEANVEGIEFISNNKKLIHHINYGIFAVPDSNVNIFTGSKYIDTNNPNANQGEYDHLAKNPVYYTGWIPGSSTEYYPKNFGWVLPKRGVVIFTVHYSASPVEAISSVGINLYFKKNPVERKVKIISFGSGGIAERDIIPKFEIAPNKISTFELKLMTREAQSVLYVWPHMHFLGKEFLAYAITPNSDTIPLVKISKWDYKWQELYRMHKLIKIPAGSILCMYGTYDNTANNPYNPNKPPQTVFSTKNMTSTMEMFTLLMIYVPYKEGDENIIL